MPITHFDIFGFFSKKTFLILIERTKNTSVRVGGWRTVVTSSVDSTRKSSEPELWYSWLRLLVRQPAVVCGRPRARAAAHRHSRPRPRRHSTPGTEAASGQTAALATRRLRRAQVGASLYRRVGRPTPSTQAPRRVARPRPSPRIRSAAPRPPPHIHSAAPRSPEGLMFSSCMKV